MDSARPMFDPFDVKLCDQIKPPSLLADRLWRPLQISESGMVRTYQDSPPQEVLPIFLKPKDYAQQFFSSNAISSLRGR